MQRQTAALSREEAEVWLEPWLASVAFSQGPLRDGLPWMVFPAIGLMETLLTKDSTVFEYGAGGSSMFFASRVKELVSVEHDAGWFKQTKAAMADAQRRHGVQWTGVLAEPQTPQNAHLSAAPDSADPLSYATSDEALREHSFLRYASAIDAHEDEYFDLVLIDGRARPSCFLHAVNKVKLGGYIVLDNAERQTYEWIESTAEKLGFEKTEFWGPGPYNEYCWRTIFLRRVRDHFALNDLDRKLEPYLDMDNGVFVEAGANDGIRQSNTLYFEARRGWRGVLVEALPATYEQCRRHRPRAHVVWAALGSPDQVPGMATLRYAELMSVVHGGMRSADEEDAHVAAGVAVQKLEASYEVQAPFATLSQILDDSGFTRIDLLSLDVEGYEARALDGLDLSRHRPRFILIEARYREDIDARLAGHYEVVAQLSHHDVLYRSLTEA